MERKAQEGCKAMVDLQLCDDNNNLKDEVMLVQVMTVDIPQSRPISESTINSFMSSKTISCVPIGRHRSNQEGICE